MSGQNVVMTLLNMVIQGSWFLFYAIISPFAGALSILTFSMMVSGIFRIISQEKERQNSRRNFLLIKGDEVVTQLLV